MAEKGLPRVTVREVAERAGVQPALVNYYFRGKAGLLREVNAEVAREVGERIRQAATREGSVEDRMRGLVEAWISGIAGELYAPRLLVEQVLFASDEVIDQFVERFARPNLGAIRSLLEAGRASGEFRAVDAKFFVPSLVGMCVFFFLSRAMVERLYGVEDYTPELVSEFAASVAELLMRGIAATGTEAS
jgi:AcrR family transcriptional regulator